MATEEVREQGSKRDQRTSTPPIREPGPGGRDRGRPGETADVGGEGEPSDPGRHADRKKPEETEIERAQEDETNAGHPERPYT